MPLSRITTFRIRAFSDKVRHLPFKRENMDSSSSLSEARQNNILGKIGNV